MNRIVILSLAAVVAHFTLACTVESTNEKTVEPEVTSSPSEIADNVDQVYGGLDKSLITVARDDNAPLEQAQMIDPASAGTPTLHQAFITKPSAPQHDLVLVIDPKK